MDTPSFGRWIVAGRLYIVVAVLGITAALGARLNEFGLDAGSNALLLENDPDLKFYDQTRLSFGSDEYVLVSFRPDNVFSADSIRLIDALTRELTAVPGVAGVMSPTNVPLLRSRGATLLDPGVDLDRAREEMTTHEVYSNNLVSRDGSAASLIVTLAADPAIGVLQREVWELDQQIEADPQDEGLERRRAEKFAQFTTLDEQRKRDRVTALDGIRGVLARHPGEEFFQSGLPVVNVDMVRYIEQDIRTFGAAAAAFFVLVLVAVFRRVRWIVLPLATCLVTVAWILGLMVLQGKKTTVVTSNISSLLFILGMEHSLHLVERYRELVRRGVVHHDAIAKTLRELWAPALFTGTTTVAGFCSLVISDIRPVIDFGIYMSIGVMLSFVLSFTFFAAGLALFRPMTVPPAAPEGQSGFGALARYTVRRKWFIAAVSLAVLAISVVGILRLNVETRFVDYFQPESAISRGLFFIDREMGGTTSLEVVLQSDEDRHFTTEEGLRQIAAVQERLGQIPEVGKVLSIHSVVTEAQKNPLMRMLPPRALFAVLESQSLVQPILRSYATEDYRSVRIFARLQETHPDLSRNRVIRELREFLNTDEDLRSVHPRLTGIFLLYANLLNSLIDSQVKTFVLALAAIVAMLAVLFRSLRIAALGILPNALPILFVLGFMGLAGIHLDMMTITIASVSLGIAVDGTIHYVFRFQEEFARDGSYEGAMVRAHESVGRPVLWTSVSVMIAFCVLALSAFKPTMYFGILTAMAMLGGLFGSLTVLPVCLLLFRPYGSGQRSAVRATPGR